MLAALYLCCVVAALDANKDSYCQPFTTASLSTFWVRIYNTQRSFAHRKRNWHVITVMKINQLNSKIYSKHNKIMTA